MPKQPVNEVQNEIFQPQEWYSFYNTAIQLKAS